jgi:hypothetical protein
VALSLCEEGLTVKELLKRARFKLHVQLPFAFLPYETCRNPDVRDPFQDLVQHHLTVSGSIRCEECTFVNLEIAIHERRDQDTEKVNQKMAGD